MTDLTTERLRLRAWRDSDLPAFAALGADPRVMEFLPKRLTWAESKARAARIRDHHLEPGYRHWVVEAPGVASFVGLLTLSTPPFEAAFTPCVEVGWRFAAEYWGRGYATEAAFVVRDYAIDVLGLRRLISIIHPDNTRSQGVARKVGMRHEKDTRVFGRPQKIYSLDAATHPATTPPP